MDMIDLIIDTDIGCDSDDVGALIIAHKARVQNKCNLLATTASVSRVDAIRSIEIINAYYGASEIPCGILVEQKCGESADQGVYSRALALNYAHLCKTGEESATRVLRRTLVNAKNKVRLVSIGTFVNIALLLKSQPDDISPLSGIELVKEKVLDLYAMAGNFKETVTEWNVNCAIPEAIFVAQNFPLPITYCPFEVGVRIKTGLNLSKSEDSPMKMAYLVFGHIPRESWDPITVYCAINGEDMFETIEGVTVNIDDNGVTTYVGGGKDRIITSIKDCELLTKTLEEIIC